MHLLSLCVCTAVPPLLTHIFLSACFSFSLCLLLPSRQNDHAQDAGGDIIPGSGTATLRNLDILTHQNDVRRLLGYCPQFDALIDTLTGREHLVLFARIKGVEEDIMADYVEHLILRLGLQEGIADKPTKGYSGGNKRKLCVGIALIGNPPIVSVNSLHDSSGRHKGGNLPACAVCSPLLLCRPLRLGMRLETIIVKTIGSDR